MGLFSKKSKAVTLTKLAGFFSRRDLAKMKEVIRSRAAGNEYKAEYRGYADDLINAIENAEKPLDKQR